LVGSGPRHDIVAFTSFSGPGSRPSGIRFRRSAPGSGSCLFGCLLPLHFCTRPRRICTFALYFLHPHPNLETRTRIPISRDLRPEDVPSRSKGDRRPEYMLRPWVGTALRAVRSPMYMRISAEIIPSLRSTAGSESHALPSLPLSGPRALRPSCPRACLPCQPVNLSTCQLVIRSGQPAN
jgi:hypothetical protein